MTWFVSSKFNQGSGYVGQLTVPVSTRVLAQSSSGDADYETVVWGSAPFVQQTGLGDPGSNVGHRNPFTSEVARHLLLRAYVLPDTVITGVGASGAGATAQIRLYDEDGTLVGILFTLAFDSGTNGTALAMTSLGTPSTTVRAFNGVSEIRESETLTFRWLQGSTGLALPASHVLLDIV